MPPREKTRKLPSKRALILIACAAAAVIVGIVITVVIVRKNASVASPLAAMQTAGIDPSSVSKVFTYKDVAAAVAAVPGKNPTLYVCRRSDGKWRFDSKVSENLSAGDPVADFLLSGDKGTDALLIVFAATSSTENIRLSAPPKILKDPAEKATADGKKVFAYHLEGVPYDKNAYTLIEYGKDNQQLTDTNFNFENGSFEIKCNGTEYRYKVSEAQDIKDSFMFRFDTAAVNFSAGSAAPSPNDQFVLTYRSKTHVVVEPQNVKNPVFHDSVTITMPLEGADSGQIFFSGSDHALVAGRAADQLRKLVLLRISGQS